MRFPGPWARRTIAAMLLLVCASWITAKTSQYRFRRRAERLFADFQLIQVNRASTAETRSLIRQWDRYGSVTNNCDGLTCRTRLYIDQTLPAFFCGQPEEGIKNIPAILADFLGFRNEYAGFEFTTESGVITQKGFGLDVALPVVEWHWWNNSYIPDLVVWSTEKTKFPESTPLNPSHPFRIARNIRGVYGMQITFTTGEIAAKQAELMHFRFSCLTQFLPCQNFGEILPEGWRMLQQDNPELKR
jgi:hypothetical protein